MRNIEEILDKISKLVITEDEYDYYINNILTLDYDIFLQVIIAIVDGKLSPKDFNVLMSDYREIIIGNVKPITLENLKSQLQSKYDNNKVTNVTLKKDESLEQLYIKEKILEKGISIPDNKWNKIFVDSYGVGELNLNYDNIILTGEDKVFMSENNINEIGMKKIKLLRDYLILRKPYTKEGA